MPYVAVTVPELLDRLGGSAHLDGDRLTIDDEAAFRGEVIRDLAWTAAFGPEGPAVDAARWLIHEAARVLGAHSAS
ncbi:MAG TPA: aldolase, partial [Candidatus Dormibacteraeota bacterium]